MSKKKNKKRNPQPTQALVRLSQCMIVKNEEKNIEKALSWGKDIVFEQIVVDTGSTDRTVEIAEKMGAKVFHFEWINDFSAAKNYAIEQASGNWIAFLDADEFISKQETKVLMAKLKKIRADPEIREKCFALNMPLINLDDNGNPSSVYDQERVFRNLPVVRYVGKIHEGLSALPDNVFRVDDVKVMHTGYSSSAHLETGKAERNIDLLRAELVERPDDMNLKVYLAEALNVVGDPESAAEADRLYLEAVNGTGGYEILRMNSYKHLIDKYSDLPGALADAEALSLKALGEFPDDIDINYFYGKVLNRKGEFQSAWKRLQRCETSLVKTTIISEAPVLMAKPMLLFRELAVSAQGCGDLPGLVRYATMLLMDDKTQLGVLAPYLSELIKNNTQDDEIRELLSNVYDLNNPQDLMLVARAAKECGALDFARKLLERTGAAINKKSG